MVVVVSRLAFVVLCDVLLIDCASRKQLTEMVAKEMLTDSIGQDAQPAHVRGDYLVDVTGLQANWLQRPTTTDLAQTARGQAGADEAPARLLFAAGLLTKSSEERPYIDATGNYVGQYPNNQGTPHPLHVQLVADKTTGQISGSYQLEEPGGRRGTIRGHMTAEATATIEGSEPMCASGPSFCMSLFPNVGYQRSLSFVRSDGSQKSVDQRVSRVPPLDLQMDGAAGGSYKLVWFTYAWSPQAALHHEGDRTRVAAGKIEVVSVTDLISVSETRATASFSWKLIKNKCGEILVEGTGRGAGRAAFGKKPDGTWTLVRYEM